METDENTRNTGNRGLATPLGVISIFVTFTEGAMSFAAVQTTGFIQMIFAAYAMILAAAVVSVFFLILWRRPWVFYHPGEYGQQDVGRYVKAMQSHHTEEISVDRSIQHSIHTTFSDDIASTLRSLPLDSQSRDTLREEIDKAAVRAVDEIRKSSFLIFDFGAIVGDQNEPWIVPFERFGSISSMLDELWLKLEERVPARSYGKYWILRDAATGNQLREMGRRYAHAVFGTSSDARSLSEAGIYPGMKLSTDLLRANA